ncbi:copper chaperone PCu(A)C [Thiomonas sp. FB-Cd]|uniref:copper chaperone PCu(A)C n=1 Tax=Thiomonas sp. FB-Cd TaxID=1158292 RepID=UPI0009E0A3D5|nr:copper chaperone PCu(A)C [Thiomonas sp. FB-Cd]
MIKTLNSHAHRLPRRVALTFVLAAAALAASPAFAADSAPVQASNAWIRWLPAGLPAGGYMQLRNLSDKPVDLVGATSADYGNTMLHHTVKKGNTMEMLPVSRVTIPAHGSVAFQPGGYHIMLMQPKKAVQPGDQVPITLEFSGGSTLRVEFQVRKADATGPGAAGGVNMHSMPGMGDGQTK